LHAGSRRFESDHLHQMLFKGSVFPMDFDRRIEEGKRKNEEKVLRAHGGCLGAISR
jgi:hypothetical protein